MNRALPSERDILERMVGKLAIDCLWCPQIKEAHAETKEHNIRVWRDDGVVRVEIKRK